MAPNRTIDARTAYWSSADTYPVELRDFTSGRQWPNVCWVGGNITTPYPDTDPWSRWHGRTAMFVLEPLPKIVDTTVSDTGDAFSFQSGATNWSMSGVHASDVHDDCVENDGMNAGIVYDSLFENCYSGFSARGWTGYTKDGSSNTETINNDLMSLGDFTSVSAGPSPSHAGFFKFADASGEGISPDLVINNSIFMADSPASSAIGTLEFPSLHGVPYLKSCSNNTMVWLGSGPYPATLPSCFRITTDRSVWDNAVAAWKASHRSSR